ncbi:hypothetical protein [Nostoc favosum]|uniref:Uncharacterized protein n=1 Tax=Nostoc favosum CHAB5714 TaxID=2780399 RepID=A0ABS8IF26_9NOSO|nr:hypothetical protein [Nostoc favosum]MCC5602845.1 hypothetical protein [Nostoc favosum CHAB5714]
MQTRHHQYSADNTEHADHPPAIALNHWTNPVARNTAPKFTQEIPIAGWSD